MASVERQPNGRWRARWRTPQGQSRSQNFDRKLDAERFLKTVEHTRVSGSYIDPKAGRQTFESFADEWSSAQDWKDTTRDGWQYARARLVSVLGPMPLDTIDLLTLQGAQQALGAKYARNTVETTMAYAGAVMRAAHVAGRIGRDPTRGLRRPKARAGEANGTVTAEQVPTRAEALAILEGAPSRYRAAIALGLTGLRVGEVLGMDASRIKLDARQVTVDQQLQLVGSRLVLTTPKAEKCRTIVVPNLVAVELRRHLRDHQGGGLLFRGVRGAPMMTRDRFYGSAWRPALKGAGLAEDRFVFHSLRHFCASSLLAEGAPLTAVAGHLGDTVETVSRVYLHWLRDDRNVPADVLDRVLAPVDGSPRVNAVSDAAAGGA